MNAVSMLLTCVSQGRIIFGLEGTDSLNTLNVRKSLKNLCFICIYVGGGFSTLKAPFSIPI